MSPSFVYITCGCSQCLLYHFHAAQNSLHGRKLLLKFLVFLCQPQHLMRMQELVAKRSDYPREHFGFDTDVRLENLFDTTSHAPWFPRRVHMQQNAISIHLLPLI